LGIYTLSKLSQHFEFEIFGVEWEKRQKDQLDPKSRVAMSHFRKMISQTGINLSQNAVEFSSKKNDFCRSKICLQVGADDRIMISRVRVENQKKKIFFLGGEKISE